nr:immunoglobulin light chain junction region [Macaca mulatta]MOV98775.1 immunoglobulin light chain junction region [Macaca mulatta]MOW00128.1 immunoglobulin light chain junction region [Macaca mulatta]
DYYCYSGSDKTGFF